MNRGEVWRVRLPFARGHVQAGERPAVVLQNDRANLVLTTALIVPFTSSMTATQFTGTTVVQPDGTNGLTLPSVALVFQLTAVDKRFFLSVLGVLDAKDLAAILAVLQKLTGP